MGGCGVRRGQARVALGEREVVLVRERVQSGAVR